MTDIAQVNLELAQGLPSSETLDVAGYLQRLDDWTETVANTTERYLPMFRRSPAKFDHSLGKFRMHALVTILQRRLGRSLRPVMPGRILLRS